MTIVNPIEKHSQTWASVKRLIDLELNKARMKMEDLQCSPQIRDVQAGKIAAYKKILSLEEK